MNGAILDIFVIGLIIISYGLGLVIGFIIGWDRKTLQDSLKLNRPKP